jgi:hypothetical protein
MTDRTNHVERLERIMEQLAESVLELSDEALFAEITESGADPEQEVERTRLVLRQAARPQEVEDQRSSNLGDTTNSSIVGRVKVYQDNCLSCGLVSSVFPVWKNDYV